MSFDVNRRSDPRSAAIVSRIRKMQNDRKRQNSGDSLPNVTFSTATVLHTFSVIFLTSLGFTFLPSTNRQTIRCNKCATEYSVAELENTDDEELNRRHASVNPNCPVLAKINTVYKGQLRIPYTKSNERVDEQILDTSGGCPSMKVLSSNVAPAVIINSLQDKTIFKQKLSSMGKNDFDEGFQDDIISDSLPDETFSGSFPSTRAANYRDESVRRASFPAGWQNRAKKNSRPDVDLLVKAGFYYYPGERKDAVKCYSCEVVLFGWKNNEDIWKKHALHSPTCSFVIERKGRKFIDDVLKHLDDGDVETDGEPKVDNRNPNGRREVTGRDLSEFRIPTTWIASLLAMGFSLDDILLVYLWKRQSTQATNTSEVFNTLQEMVTWVLTRREEAARNFHLFSSEWPSGPKSNESIGTGQEDEAYVSQERRWMDGEDAQTCKICFSKPANTVLMPCSHLVSCDACTSRLRLCPICRKVINATILTASTV